MQITDVTDVPTIKAARTGLQRARQAHKVARAELQRIGALSSSQPDLTATRAAVEVAQADLADVVAAHALRETDADQIKHARAALAAAESAHLEAEATAAEAARLSEGLERRLSVAHQVEAEAKAAVYRAENVLALAMLFESDNCYTAACRVAVKHLKAARSAAVWIKYRDPSMLPAAASTVATSFGLPTIGPISAAAARRQSSGLQHGIGQLLYGPNDVKAEPDLFQNEMLLEADVVDVDAAS